jgi:hypothetical protein
MTNYLYIIYVKKMILIYYTVSLHQFKGHTIHVMKKYLKMLPMFAIIIIIT